MTTTMSFKRLLFSASKVAARCMNQGTVTSVQSHANPAVLGPVSARCYYDTAKFFDSDPTVSRLRTVDLRSDTVTKPRAVMRQAMAGAEVGDDVFSEDPTVNELQMMAADMFGMEDSLFVPSGTMSNLVAIMVHCRERGDEMIAGDLSHIHVYEQGGSAQLAGVHCATVANLPDGTFDLAELESKIRHGYPDPHYPRSRLICLENTHNIQGGRVLPLAFLQEVRAMADKYGLAVHMDGARLMNAAVYLGVPLTTILQYTDTVSVCLSKGLGAPVGTLLAGPRDFIARAVRCRKALGGGMRKAGILAAGGKMALGQTWGQLEEDHRNAKTFAQALLDSDPPLYTLDMAAVETNIVRFHIQDPTLTPSDFCALMAEVGPGEERALGQGVRVLMFPFVGGAVRAVWHDGITPEDTQLAIQKMQFVTAQYAKDRLRAQ